MARMIPAHGPRTGKDTPRSVATAWSRLERGLPDDWTVVHGARWLGSARRGEPLPDGEAEFVIAQPDAGVLVLSLALGGLLCDPNGGRWSRLDGDRHSGVSDPFDAARTAADALVATLAQHPGWPASRPVVAHGVLLPDAIAPTAGFAPHAPRALCLDRDDCQRLPDAVRDLLQRRRRDHPPTGNAPASQWWRAFDDLFAMPREARVRLQHRIAADQQQMGALAPQQLAVLDLTARVRRQAIAGAAGTGKTVLAVHKTRLLARQGQRVLLTCFNKALGHHLRAVLRDEPLVTAIHFHELCAERAGLLDVAPPQLPALRDAWFDRGLAEALMQAAHRNGPWFDALVVDEAQDFLAPWWDALAATLHDPERCVRYLFFDDAQRLRPDAAPVAGADEALTLQTNWRNTGHVHAWLALLEPSLQEVRCAAPEGVPVDVEFARPDVGRALRRVLHKVVVDGGMAPEDVVVLTGRAPARSRIAELEHELLPFRVTQGEAAGAVRLRSVQAFKGMEVPVVVLAEIDGGDAERRRRLRYVGGSRATNLLVLIVEPGADPLGGAA
jgi:hypothetical protein